MCGSVRLKTEYEVSVLRVRLSKRGADNPERLRRFPLNQNLLLTQKGVIAFYETNDQ